MLNRRSFMTAGAAAAALSASSSSFAAPSDSASLSNSVDVLRVPDRILARFAMKDVQSMQRSADVWSCRNARVKTILRRSSKGMELPVQVESDRDLTFLHVRWSGKTSEKLLSIGDHWERSYGDLEWRGTVPDRVMPWYFMTTNGKHHAGYGVKTQPSAFCFWQRDTDGVTLTIDLRNGGNAAELKGRELLACSVMMADNEQLPINEFSKRFCARMCTSSRLPKGPIFGSNDWNYAYGKNTADGILRDAELITSLAPSGGTRPYTVIDDGYQDPTRFPDLADLATKIRQRGTRPGIWIRPMRPEKTVSENLLLPSTRFGRGSQRRDPSYDPTIAEAMEAVMHSVSTPVSQGYEFIKHDFSTYEIFGRWGFEMGGMVAQSGWNFQDRSKTNAEIVLDLYAAIRRAAGEKTVILGCNTVGHLAAGFFESQRIADDTSGREWERTRRTGVNGLAHRMGQHGTFFHIDPDIVAITQEVAWQHTKDWMDVIALSGTSFFVAPDPRALTSESKASLKDSLQKVAGGSMGYAQDVTSSSTPNSWIFKTAGREKHLTFDWCGEEGPMPFEVT